MTDIAVSSKITGLSTNLSTLARLRSFITTKIRRTLLKNQKMSLKKVFSKIQLSPKLLRSRISIQQKITKEYYENNRNAPYCNFVIDPKMQKLIKYSDEIKQEYL